MYRIWLLATLLFKVTRAQVSAGTPYLIRLQESDGSLGPCLTAASNADSAALTISACTNSTSQQWTFSTSLSGSSPGNIKVFGSKCIDVTNGVDASGTKMQIYTCFAGNTNQEWIINQSGSTIQFQWFDHTRCLDNTNGVMTNGNQIQIWACGSTFSNQKWQITPVQSTAATYDYIVVGSGAGGLVAADRLSQAGKKVLLLERGGPSTFETGGRDFPPWATGSQLTRFDIPAIFPALFGSSGPTYWFCSDVMSFAGCILGGGTSINGGNYWYPNDLDFSTALGWPTSWTNHTPYTNMLISRLPSTDHPSTDGQRYNEQTFGVMGSILGGLGYSAITINNSPNSKNLVYGYTGYNFQQGKRWGPVATYFQTSRARSNFAFATNTLVTSLARNGGTITGVRTNNTALGTNGLIQLSPNGRVILSAGALSTPRILFQSGIGPNDMISLVAANSAAASQLPPSSQYIINNDVGFHASDNPSVNLFFTHPSVDSYDNFADVFTGPPSADSSAYLKNQSGILAQSSPRVNFWQSLKGPDGITRYLQGTVRPGGSPTTKFAFNATQVFTVDIYLSLGLTSRGRVGIDSNLNVVILTNPWFQDVNDKNTIINGINSIVTAAKKVSGLTLITPDNTTTVPDYVNNYPVSSLHSNHWVGTCSIGKVVDDNAKVFNTTNLFIIDASIIPGQPMTNIQGNIMSVAEQAVAKVLALAGGP